MTTIIGIIAAALLFGLFAGLRPKDRSCSGNCLGCKGDRSCEPDVADRPPALTRNSA